MKKMYIEIIASVTAVILFIGFIIMINHNKSIRSIGFTIALLVFVIVMGLIGIKLAEFRY
ncbi:MAG TPA: hypothetical protein EYP22_00225 [Methanosarcinales archaeon]|nr:hypothetical protein [Methanosarcinales archaeon]